MLRSPEKARVQTDMAFYNEMTYVFRELKEDFSEQQRFQPYFNTFDNALQKFKEFVNKNDQLVSKIQDLNQKLLQNAQNVKQIITQVGYDKEEMKELGLEYENAMRKLEIQKKKEKDAQSTVEGLKSDFNQYNEIAQEYFAKENEKEDYQNQNDNIRKEIEENQKQIEELTNQLKEANNINDVSQKELNETKENYDNLVKEDSDTTDLIANLKQSNIDCVDEMENVSKNIEKMEKETIELNEKIKTTVIDPNLKKQISQLKLEKEKQLSKKESLEYVYGYKKKGLSVLMKQSDGTISYCEKIKKKIAKRETQIEDLKIPLKEQEIENKRIKPQADELAKHSLELRKEKLEKRKISRNMLKQIVGLEFDNIKVTNQENMVDRRISAEKHTLSNIEQDVIKEQNAQIEAKNKQSVLNIETMNCRIEKQKMMENAARILNEIEQREVEKSRIKIDLLTVTNQIQSINAENEQLIADLNEIKKKTSKQIPLIERMRTERMMYKKMSESAIAETDILQKQFDDLLTSIKEMTDKIDYLMETTQNEHEAATVIKEANVFIERMRDETLQGVKTSEKVNQQLIQEGVNLQGLLHKSEWDFRQQKKEYSMLVNTYHIVANQLHQKEKKIQEMKSDIESMEAVLIKSRQQYNEKIQEITKIMSDYEYYYNVNGKLSDLWMKTQKLLQKKKELSENLEYEQLKKATLFEELKVPRNVHRYTLLSGENPELAKQYRYFFYVHFRLQETTVELDKVRKIRDELQKALDHKVSLVNAQTLTVDECKQRIKVYRNDVIKKDKEIAEMQHMIDNIRLGIYDEADQLNETRASVSQRRASAVRMKSRRATLVRQNVDNDFFLTSAKTGVVSDDYSAKEGFLPKAPQSARDSRRFRAKGPSPIHEPPPKTSPTKTNNVSENKDFNSLQVSQQIHCIPHIMKINKKGRGKSKQPKSARRAVKQSDFV